MRLKFSALFLIIAISACTFQVNVIETPTPAATVLPTESSTSNPVPTSTSAATQQPLPTFGAINASPLSPVGSPQSSVFPIQFSPNGTYVDVIDSIQAGESKTYSVRAMQGQVMSISFHQNEETEWTYISMQIRGTDTSLLCNDCEFWRGILPATQDYFVTVTPSADASDFTMRVAINPPGVAKQYFLYENKYRNASLSYADLFAPAFFPGAPISRIPPELTLRYIDTQSYANTNLIEAYLLFGSSTDPQVIATCTEPVTFDAAEAAVGDVMINGVSFTKTESSGVGAGNVYEQTHYRAAQNGTCFEFTYFVHYGNIGNYDPATVTEFDRDALLRNFDEVLSSFTLK